MATPRHTSDGEPLNCPKCHAILAIEFSEPTREVRCRECGCMLWCVVIDETALAVESSRLTDSVRKRIQELIERGDSLATVELVMEVEAD